MDIDPAHPIDEATLLELLQEGELSHPDLCRRARRIHERKLAQAVHEIVADPEATARELRPPCHGAVRRLHSRPSPTPPPAAFLGREKFKLTRSDGDRPRVALVADGLGGMHGVTHTIQQIRERGVPGYEVEVIGTDCDVDRRLSAVAEIDIPFYRGLQVGVPSLPAIVETLAEGRYDLVHLTSPGPAGIGAWLLARVLELPVIGSYHTELAAYAGLRSGAAQLEAIAGAALGAFYGACDVVLSPSPASDERLAELGIASTRVGRWDRGVDLDRFDPRLRDAEMFGGEVNVLYCGRLTREKGVDLLADAFLRAREAGSAAAPGARRRRPRGGGAARTPRRPRAHSWAGCREATCPRPTPPPTRSCSPAGPTPSARSSSRPRPRACRSSRSPRAARRR